MHFLKPEIEMFINRNSDDDDEREEGKGRKTLSQLALVLCF
jgi:hypothetical protein